jgi:hypothetical protein
MPDDGQSPQHSDFVILFQNEVAYSLPVQYHAPFDQVPALWSLQILLNSSWVLRNSYSVMIILASFKACFKDKSSIQTPPPPPKIMRRVNKYMEMQL